MKNVNTNPYTGVGMKQEWINNAPQEVIYMYKNNISKKINPDEFILNLYKYWRKHFNFVITFEYPKSKKFTIVRPNIYINGNFIFGLDWCSNKWNAITTLAKHNKNSDSLHSISDLSRI